MMRHPLTRALALYLAVAVVMLSFPAQGWSMIVPAEREAVRSADLDGVRAALESSVVRQRLLDLGLTADEAAVRIERLSDEQLHQLAANLEAVQAGGSVLGDVLVVALIVLIVIVILELSGHRIVMRR